jgi:uncharacterized membrane protein YbaN (DUF454 family)
MQIQELPSNSIMNQIRHWLLLGTGVTCVALAALGAILPGMPTVIFLIAAAYFLARSSPALEKRLVRNQFFGPYLAYVDGKKKLSAAAKLALGGLILLSGTISGSGLALTGAVAPWVVVVIIGLAAVGALVVWLR